MGKTTEKITVLWGNYKVLTVNKSEKSAVSSFINDLRGILEWPEKYSLAKDTSSGQTSGEPITLWKI